MLQAEAIIAMESSDEPSEVNGWPVEGYAKGGKDDRTRMRSKFLRKLSMPQLVTVLKNEANADLSALESDALCLLKLRVEVRLEAKAAADVTGLTVPEVRVGGTTAAKLQ